MHRWTDEGIVLNVTRYGEQSAVVRVLTVEHGLCAGLVKGAFSKANRGMYQAANRVHLHRQARLEEHLGMMRGELIQSVTAELLANPLALKGINALCSMVLAIVPEHVVEIKLYRQAEKTIDSCRTASDFLKQYALFELVLLQSMGFGLDLAACAATGDKQYENLIYVSPKSGRAVCREAGAPYRAKMLALPAFFHDHALPVDAAQVLDALNLTGYFLEQWVLLPEGKQIPAARTALLERVTVRGMGV